MNIGNGLGLSEHQEVVAAFQVKRVICEAFASEIFLLKLEALNHGSHGAIENQNTLLESDLEPLVSECLRHGIPLWGRPVFGQVNLAFSGRVRQIYTSSRRRLKPVFAE